MKSYEEALKTHLRLKNQRGQALALQKRGGWLGLFKRPKVFQAEVEARKLPL